MVTGGFVFAIPGDLATATGGYAYDRRIIAELRALGWQPEVLALGEGFPRPNALTLAAAGASLALVAKGKVIVVDGLAFGVMPEAARNLCETHPLLALVHHPLALETGLRPEDAARLRESERAALACTRGVVVTSPTTARTLAADYGVAPERITVARPGTDRPALRRRNPSRASVALLAIGAVVPRKGYDLLVAALAELLDLPWTLTIAGDTGRDPVMTDRLKAAIARHRLTSRVTIAGAVTDQALAALYASSDLFVLPSRHEGFGMAYAEAIAHGLPVIGTTAGAIHETVGSAGVLVPPDNVPALAAALRRLIEDREARERLAAQARAAELPTWRESAQLFAQAIERAI